MFVSAVCSLKEIDISFMKELHEKVCRGCGVGGEELLHVRMCVCR